ncbi:unnamed protein product [Cuscuta epithymum]|uniref:Alpha/beta hydrolase fold-3 domain-containing protein n=1 Tax=Cuscuta epithymum TaxID=186058 RepID=A0AAV0DWD5_9ASTE|nr:unnamed protein product [Cuscuta epithymum]
MGDSDSQQNIEILHDFPPLLRVYKDGRIERLQDENVVPPDPDAETGVRCKDVQISPDPTVSARIFLPKTARPGRKLPLLVYFHGGAFVSESAFSPTYKKPLCLISAEANAVIVSVDYRLAPEHVIPACFDDSWLALKWVASHSSSGGSGGEEWLKEYADLNRAFFGGDSAGGTIAHRMAIRVGLEGLDGIKLDGVFLNCPFFWGKDPVGEEGEVAAAMGSLIHILWELVNPKSSGLDDPLLNPTADPEFSSLGCKKVLVYVAEKDNLRRRGRHYTEVLVNSGWPGTAEVVEVKGEDHGFSVSSPTSDNSMAMVKKLATFINK